VNLKVVSELLLSATLVTMSLCFCNGAKADVYRYVTKDDDGDAIFLDETTVVRVGARVDYWVLNIESTYLRGVAAKSAYYLTRQSVNCDTQTMRSTDMSIYGVTGKRLASDSAGNEESSIEPGTIEQSFFQILCMNEASTGAARSKAATPLEAVRAFRAAIATNRPRH
jgi:hypothetical protein